jgi:hypothetical protein
VTESQAEPLSGCQVAGSFTQLIVGLLAALAVASSGALIQDVSGLVTLATVVGCLLLVISGLLGLSGPKTRREQRLWLAVALGLWLLAFALGSAATTSAQSWLGFGSLTILFVTLATLRWRRKSWALALSSAALAATLLPGFAVLAILSMY